jgi:hypothetical protein
MPDLIIENTDEDFNSWSGRDFLSDQVRKSILNKNVLIVPIEKFRDYSNPLFPVGTEELFHYLKDNSENKLSVEVCIDDEDYKELALHSDLIIICGFVVTVFVAPILVNLISSYIENRWVKKSHKESTKLKVEITVVDNDKGSKKFKYEGAAKDFKETMNEALKANQLIKKRDKE